VVVRTSIQSIWPNPGGSRRTVIFDLVRESHVRVRLFDAEGRALRTFTEERLPAGRHRREWHVGNVAGGLYFLRLEADGDVRTRKIVMR
jgi:hypothetical protein